MYQFQWWLDDSPRGTYHCGDPQLVDDLFSKESVKRGLEIGFSMLRERPAGMSVSIWFD